MEELVEGDGEVTVLHMKTVCWLAIGVTFDAVCRGRYRVVWRMKKEHLDGSGPLRLHAAFSSGIAAEGFNIANEAKPGYTQLTAARENTHQSI